MEEATNSVAEVVEDDEAVATVADESDVLVANANIASISFR